MNNEIPTYPFEIVGSDLFTFQGRDYILIADSYSGFYDFKQLKHTTTKEVTDELKNWFALFGIPRTLITDNGPQYSSHDFKQFSSEWQFNHQTSSPYYPKSNGLSERYVQTAKNLLRKCAADNSCVQKALLNSRNTPRKDVMSSPNQRLMSRMTRSLVPATTEQLKPKLVENIPVYIKNARELQRQEYNKTAQQETNFKIGETVRMQRGYKNWILAKIVKKLKAPRSYLLKTTGGKYYRRNTAHIRPTAENFTERNESIIWFPSEVILSEDINIRNDTSGNQQQQSIVSHTAITESTSDTGTQPTTSSRYGRPIKPIIRMDL